MRPRNNGIEEEEWIQGLSSPSILMGAEDMIDESMEGHRQLGIKSTQNSAWIIYHLRNATVEALFWHGERGQLIGDLNGGLTDLNLLKNEDYRCMGDRQEILMDEYGEAQKDGNTIGNGSFVEVTYQDQGSKKEVGEGFDFDF